MMAKDANNAPSSLLNVQFHNEETIPQLLHILAHLLTVPSVMSRIS